MAIVLTMGEMITAIGRINPQVAQMYRLAANAVATEAAAFLAKETASRADAPQYFEDANEGVCFHPTTNGQPVPDAFDELDPDGHDDWEAEADDLPPAPEQS